MNAYPRMDRTGWHAATVTIVVCGVLATLLSGISLVGIYFLFWTIPATVMGVLCGLINHRAWRAILAGLAMMTFFTFSFFAFFWGLFTVVLGGLGLLLMLGSIFGGIAFVCCIVELVKTINGNASAMRAGQFYDQPYQVPAIVIHNNSSAQVGNNDNRQLNYVQISGGARIGILEGGRKLPEVSIRAGQALIVGRGQDAHIHVSDDRASRQHVQIQLDGASWVISDLGARNPARLVGGGGDRYLGNRRSERVASGQLLIGDAVITLYPVAPGR